MSYFASSNFICSYYPHEWDEVVSQIKSWKRPYPITNRISQHLEAKTLYVFTMTRRLILASSKLRDPKKGWKPRFLEASILLFPMLELVGYSRLDKGQILKYFGKRGSSNANLWAGLHWLRDPKWVPVIMDNKQKSDPTIMSRWEIGHLVSLRHFLLHGSKSARDKSGNPLPIQDIINFELPGFIIEVAQPAMSQYWKDLKQDDGTHFWVERMAESDIRPLPIQGSVDFKKCIIDLKIIEFLES